MRNDNTRKAGHQSSVFAHALIVACILLASASSSGAQRSASGRLIVLTSFPESLFSRFVSAFEKHHPNIKIHVRAKKTSAAISFVQERRGEPVDIIWASAPDAFEVLKRSGHLAHTFDAPPGAIRAVGDYPLDDPDGYYRGFAISGYGIMWNRPYLAREGLPIPRQWDDLRRPEFYRHVGISAPSRSGTTHLIVETLLQGKGWENGWAALLEIGGNLATVTARSFGVRDGVRAGRFGAGLVVDFFGLSSAASGAPTGFAYPNSTAFLPANIAVVKGARNRAAADAFVAFVLSSEGQTILREPAIARLPVRRESYRGAAKGFPNPFDDTLVEKGIRFDTQLSRKRYHLVNALFDTVITFNLKSLNQTWKAIHDAETAVQASRQSILLSELREARRLVGAIPVSTNQAADQSFTSIFVRRRPGLSPPNRQTHLENSWRRLVRHNRAEAVRIARDVLSRLGTQPQN